MNLIVLILSRSIRQMLAIFWSEFQKSVSKLKKVVVLPSRPPQNVELGIFTSWSCNDAPAELLFCQSKHFFFCRFC